MLYIYYTCFIWWQRKHIHGLYICVDNTVDTQYNTKKTTYLTKSLLQWTERMNALLSHVTYILVYDVTATWYPLRRVYQGH